MISDCFAPRLGGIETLVGELASQFAARGDSVDVLTATAADDSTKQQCVSPTGVRVHRVTSRISGDLPISWRAKQRIRETLRSRMPDVVIVHCGVVSPFAYAGVNAALDLGLPTIVIWHCTLGGKGVALMRATRLAATWQRRGAVFAAVSSYAASWVRKAGLHEVQVLPNAITAASWVHPDPQTVCQNLRDQDQRQPLQVVSAIRLTQAKRPKTVISAFVRAEQRARRMLGGQTPVAQLTICGDGLQMRSLQGLISRYQLNDRVRLIGRVSREALATRYHNAQIYCTASLGEAFGISSLEARTAGLAVVGRAGTGMDDFIHDERSGLLAKSDEHLAGQLTRLFTDRELLARICCHNLFEAPKEVWSNVLAQWDALIEKARR